MNTVKQAKRSMASSLQQKAQDKGIKIHLTVPQGDIDRLRWKHRSQSNSPNTSAGNITPDSACSHDGSENLSSDTDNSFYLLKSTEKLKRKEKGKKCQKNKNLLQGQQLDRFIPNRATTNTEISHYKITLNGNDIPDEEQTDYEKIVETTLFSGKSLKEYPVLSFSNKSKSEALLKNQDNNTYDDKFKCKDIHCIPSSPERILDAPDLVDDYYLQLMDWSKEGNLAVAIYNSVYIWNCEREESWMLFSLDDASYYVSSVSWIEEGSILAIGISDGIIQLWDAVEQKLLRTMRGHIDRVASLSWHTFILSSGSRSGFIHHHDVRIPDPYIFAFTAHNEEVCGLKWAPDGQYLASGGNDNLLHVWSSVDQHTATYTFSEHSSAVKAIAWCPWQHSLLATGGGIDDHNIHIRNMNMATCIETVDIGSQICDLLWIENHHELISAHGTPSNHLAIWKYPGLKKLTELRGHTGRVLSLALSPDGSMVASAAADETIILWGGFGINESKKRENAKYFSNTSIFTQTVR